MESLKRWARRVVHAPDPQKDVPTISTKDVLRSYKQDPTTAVSFSTRFRSPSKSLEPIAYYPTYYSQGDWLPQVALPSNPMGSQLQFGVAHRRLYRWSYGWNGIGPSINVLC